jgi:hypothetical protein
MHRILRGDSLRVVDIFRTNNHEPLPSPFLFIIGPERPGPEHDSTLLQRYLKLQMFFEEFQYGAQAIRGARKNGVKLLSQHALAGVLYVIGSYGRFWHRCITLSPTIRAISVETVSLEAQDYPIVVRRAAIAPVLNFLLLTFELDAKKTMRFRINRQLKRSLLILGCLAFACRLVIPPGYMPASLADGGPVVFCPVGLPVGFGQETGHHHHDDGEDTQLEELAWENCAFGAVFDSEALVADIVPLIPSFETDFTAIWREEFIVSSSPAAFHSRAPPSLYT